MANEPTAWEDINPPMVLAQRQEPPSTFGALLTPASADDFRNELTACLTLVAPVGMNEEAKRDWLAVAWGTLSHLPADLLQAGCRTARETCDHPSKIVPVVIAATRETLERRREPVYEYREYHQPQIAAPEPEYVTPIEAAKILAEFGLKRNPTAETA
jgi:hypothetical protein